MKVQKRFIEKHQVYSAPVSNPEIIEPVDLIIKVIGYIIKCSKRLHSE
jgi:hypothetical protein